MTSARRYKCPNCKHTISITNADFIKGIAMASCGGCGRDAFAIEEALLK
jgi:transcription elongation factor Elf1